MQKMDPFRSKSLEAQHVGESGRHLVLQFLQEIELTGQNDFRNFPREILADPGKPRQDLAPPDLVGEARGQALDRTCRAAIGADPKRIGILDFQQVSDLVEDGGDLAVRNRYGGRRFDRRVFRWAVRG